MELKVYNKHTWNLLAFLYKLAVVCTINAIDFQVVTNFSKNDTSVFSGKIFSNSSKKVTAS